MSNSGDKSAGTRRRDIIGDLASYGLIAGAVVLGWQIALQPLVQRAPVELAIRLSPGSPLVLGRAAESELAAGRVENAAALAREALIRSPFDVRVLRIVGLAVSRAGRENEADEILTLAGNWSLRDDPAHAWLVERRLRRGDYASSFAHADTLVRRRQDIQPQIFRLFTVAGTSDPQRAVPAIANVLAARPPWRGSYLESLGQSPQELQLAASLAVLLEASGGPLNTAELQQLYWKLLAKEQHGAIRSIRAQTSRPPPAGAVTNSDFDTEAPAPFQWQFPQAPGIVGEIVPDDLDDSNLALRVEYDGVTTGPVVEQLTYLPAGVYRFSAETRVESGSPDVPLAWTLSCTSGGAPLATFPLQVRDARRSRWTTQSNRFEVRTACQAQWLRLVTRAGDHRSPNIVWYDRIAIEREE